MAFLDVSDILSDPDFADSFTVNRRQETVDTHGRSTLATSSFPGIIGVVTMASPNDLKRLEESQYAERHLSIVTTFKMRGPSPGYQPDTIVWQGDEYVVNYVEMYPQFGRGFYQVIVGSMDSEDAAQ